jgi:dipeptidyl aminopeptidase/acylaminoacyl peptidase
MAPGVMNPKQSTMLGAPECPISHRYSFDMHLKNLWLTLSFSLCLISANGQAQSSKPTITLDEYLNTTDISGARLSPDGSSAVIATDAPDWKDSVYRHDLWIWNTQSGLRPLTRSAGEEQPQWSPDGRWIAFLSDRSLLGDDASADTEATSDASKPKRIWIISATGGEPLPLYSEKLDAHAFAWSTDSTALYFSVQEPLGHDQAEARETEWQDVIRWREQNRGDVLLKADIVRAVANALAVPLPNGATAAKAAKGRADTIAASPLPAGASALTKSALAIDEIAPSPNGKAIAFLTGPVHRRVENPSDNEIYLVASVGGEARQLTHNEAIESGVRWAPDSRWLHFVVSAAAGSLEGSYRDVQGRLYRVDTETAKVERLGSNFDGSFDEFALLPDGREFALGLKGTETQIYLVEGDKATKLPGSAGTYAAIDAGAKSDSLLLRQSSLNKPAQVYLASDPLHPDQLKALTNFNPIFAERAQPEWQPYTWQSDDGRTVEGVLIFPPGKKGAKHLRMLTLIHGGPADADGDRFGADWYDWATLAADRGWLVFRPNYRGSSGYGDDFMLEIEPHLVSKPGRDILTGVDALVKDGYPDPNHLAIGGYSYGGYMTNWLITQTTRFRAAVTGAGAVEHAANWGNDDETWDDAWYLGGQPWQNPELYQSEAALFQFNKVKTPTHLVQGGSDIRVSYLEGVTMERAFQALGVPHTFLVFPGEGHGLDKNPWHGYIKLREELKWLEKYDGN